MDWRVFRDVSTLLGSGDHQKDVDMGERARNALTQFRAKGARLGRPVEQADAVRHRVAEMHASGMSLSAIARTLNDEQIPTARDRCWHASTISRVLRSLQLDAEAKRAGLLTASNDANGAISPQTATV